MPYPVIKHLRGRLSEFDLPGMQPINAATKRALDAHERIESEVKAIRDNRDLGLSGQNKEIEKVLKGLAHEFVRAKTAASSANAQVEQHLSAVQLPAVDKTDAARAAMKAQIRDRLTPMSLP